MKYLALLTLLALSGCRQWTADSRIAEGDWKVEIEVPPCNPAHMRLVVPSDIGGPAMIVCDAATVSTR